MKILRIVFLLLFLTAPAVMAQQATTGVVIVTVEESMGMVRGLLVRSAGQSARTDSAGVARLRLPVGPQTLSVTGIGFKPSRVEVIVYPDSVVRVTAKVEMGEMIMEAAR